MTTLARDETIAALRALVGELDAAVESGTWTAHTQRLLNIADQIAAWVDGRRLMAVRPLFNERLELLCVCGRPMTVTRRSADGQFGGDGPLDGEHGRADIERRCDCGAQIDITIHA